MGPIQRMVGGGLMSSCFQAEAEKEARETIDRIERLRIRWYRRVKVDNGASYGFLTAPDELDSGFAWHDEETREDVSHRNCSFVALESVLRFTDSIHGPSLAVIANVPEELVGKMFEFEDVCVEDYARFRFTTCDNRKLLVPLREIFSATLGEMPQMEERNDIIEEPDSSDGFSSSSAEKVGIFINGSHLGGQGRATVMFDLVPSVDVHHDHVLRDLNAIFRWNRERLEAITIEEKLRNVGLNDTLTQYHLILEDMMCGPDTVEDFSYDIRDLAPAGSPESRLRTGRGPKDANRRSRAKRTSVAPSADSTTAEVRSRPKSKSGKSVRIREASVGRDGKKRQGAKSSPTTTTRDESLTRRKSRSHSRQMVRKVRKIPRSRRMPTAKFAIGMTISNFQMRMEDIVKAADGFFVPAMSSKEPTGEEQTSSEEKSGTSTALAKPMSQQLPKELVQVLTAAISSFQLQMSDIPNVLRSATEISEQRVNKDSARNPSAAPRVNASPTGSQTGTAVGVNATSTASTPRAAAPVDNQVASKADTTPKAPVLLETVAPPSLGEQNAETRSRTATTATKQEEDGDAETIKMSDRICEKAEKLQRELDELDRIVASTIKTFQGQMSQIVARVEAKNGEAAKASCKDNGGNSRSGRKFRRREKKGVEQRKVPDSNDDVRATPHDNAAERPSDDVPGWTDGAEIAANNDMMEEAAVTEDEGEEEKKDDERRKAAIASCRSNPSADELQVLDGILASTVATFRKQMSHIVADLESPVPDPEQQREAPMPRQHKPYMSSKTATLNRSAGASGSATTEPTFNGAHSGEDEQVPSSKASGMGMFGFGRGIVSTYTSLSEMAGVLFSVGTTAPDEPESPDEMADPDPTIIRQTLSLGVPRGEVYEV